MAGAGDLPFRFTFSRREDVDDGYGNTVSGDFVDQFTLWTGCKFLRGGEGVIAARLEARQPAILTVRVSPEARRISADWRAVDADGVEYAIRENPKLSDDRSRLEMLVEAGVAA